MKHMETVKWMPNGEKLGCYFSLEQRRTLGETMGSSFEIVGLYYP